MVQFSVCTTLLLCLAYVQAQHTRTFEELAVTLRILTSSVSECGSVYNPAGLVECDGGLERELVPGSPPVATNAIPAVQDVVLKYEGSIPGGAYMSLIDTQFDCGTYAHTPTPNNLYSGIQEASADKIVTIPQADAGGNDVLLSSTQNGQEQIYTVCYSCNNATGTCATGAPNYDWRDTGIRLHISRVESIIAYDVVHKTEGTIPNHADLHITYTGPLDVGKWMSFVDDTMNNNFPCASGSVATAPMDSGHSGSLNANSGTREFNFPSEGLSADRRFAVCYAEAGGIESSQWRDSGIRVRKSVIIAADYGVAEKFGTGFTRRTWNRYSDRTSNSDADVSTDRLARVSGAMLQIVGDLSVAAGSAVDVSLVEATLMNHNPCLYPQIATADPSTFNYKNANSPLAQGSPFAGNRRHFTGPTTSDSEGKVSFQTGSGNLLDHDDADCSGQSDHHFCDYGTVTEYTYALCYSIGIDSDRPSLTTEAVVWADSYLRFKLTDIEAIKHHGVLHATNGQLPRSTVNGTAGPGDIHIEYEASSDQTYSPAVGFAPGTGLGNSDRDNNRLFFVVDSTYTPANDVTSDPCGQIKGSSWHDLLPSSSNEYQSGVIPVETSGADNTLFSFSTNILHAGEVDAGTRILTQTYFAVCYSRDYITGTESNADWFDTGIRLTISRINSIEHGNTYGSINYVQSTRYQARTMYSHWRHETSDGSSLRTDFASWDGNHYYMNYENGQARAHNIISQEPNQLIKYNSVVNSETSDLWIALVDATLNGGSDSSGNHHSKPCVQTEASKAADPFHSGAMRATDSKVTLLQNVPLSETTLFAVCYAMQTGTSADLTWDDTYVRVRISQVSRIRSLGVVHEIYDDDKYVSTIANRGDEKLDLTYEGTLPAGSSLSLVNEVFRSSEVRRGNVPVCQDYATNSDGKQASGALSTMDVVNGVQADAASKTVLVRTSYLWHNITFAVCYQSSSGSWQDSGIRMRRSEFSSARYYNIYEAPAAREQTSIYHSTNKLPRASNVEFKYIADKAPEFDLYQYTPTPNGRYVALVAVQEGIMHNSMNPCTVGNFTAATSFGSTYDSSGNRSISTAIQSTANNDAHCSTLSGNTGPKECGDVIVPQLNDDAFLDADLVFALCFCNDCTGTDDDQKSWYDSYIRLGITHVASLAQSIGQWGSSPGVTITHLASGQIPNMRPAIENSGLSNEGMANEGLAISYTGSGLGNSISACLVEWTTNPSTQYGITYYNPCEDTSKWTDSTPIVSGYSDAASTTQGTITDLDTTSLNPDKTYAFCYSKGQGYRDTGIRLTVPKLINVQRHSLYAGIEHRSQKAVFRPTNRVPQSEGQGEATELRYLGALADSKFIQLIKVETTSPATKNPCVTSSLLGASSSSGNTGALTANSNSVFSLPTLALLQAGEVFALCYSDGALATSYTLPEHQFQSDEITPKNENTWSSGLPYQNTQWRDSYIRIEITLVSALNVASLVTTTNGQIPNTHAGMYFQYLGDMPNGRWISLVQDTAHVVNGFHEPCSDSTVGQTHIGTHSGKLQAAFGTNWIDTLDTTTLHSNITFALCYSGIADGNSDWRDTGIRVTTTKVFSIESSSQHTGGSGNCMFLGGDPTYNSSAYSGDCKRDTMSRQQTSKPLSTNRLAQDGTEKLSYVGDLTGSGQIAFVKIDSNRNTNWDGSFRHSAVFNGSSPCANYVGSTNDGAYDTASAPLDANENKMFELPSNVEFEEGVTVSVCYYDHAATTSYKWRDSLIRLKVSRIGSFKVTLPALVLGTTSLETSITDIAIKTVGQIPRQAPNSQVIYSYSGSRSTLGGHQLALVEDMQDVTARTGAGPAIDRAGSTFKHSLEETYGFVIHHPCETYDGSRTPTQQAFTAASGFQTQGVDTWSSYQDTNADGYHEGASSYALLSNDLSLRSGNTVYDDPAGDHTARTMLYALCYDSSSGWFDSGIRVTLSQLEDMHYRDTQAQRMYDTFDSTSWQGIDENAGDADSALDITIGRYKVMQDHTTRMDSTFLSTNTIPQLASSSDGGTVLTYGRWVEAVGIDNGKSYIRSDLSGGRIVSFVDASLNSHNPCVDPSHAAHVADSKHSGAIHASNLPDDPSAYARSINLTRSQQLRTDSIFAVCYSDSMLLDRGQSSDVHWRDSYMRVTISHVESVVSYQVTHKTIGGQIPNHAALKINYVGSLPSSNMLALVNTHHADSWINSLQAYFPCSNQSVAGGASGEQRSGLSSTGILSGSVGGSSVVTIDTTNLDTTLEMAVCYTYNGAFYDSGIRVTLPRVYKFTYKSRYWSDSGNEGTPNRDLTSFDQEDGYTLIDRPTSRAPRSRYLGALLSFEDGVHSTATSVIDGSERLSIVHVSNLVNSQDPCTDPVIAQSGPSGNGASSTSSLLYGPGSTTPTNVDVNGATRITVPAYNGVITQENTGTGLLGDETPDEVFAICYTDGIATVNDNRWRDTYVRVKLTLVNSIVVGGVRHFTFGHIPVTAAADDMRFHYNVQGSLGVEKAISLVDSTMGSGLPCATELNGTPLPAVGSASSDNDNWYYINGTLNVAQPHLIHWANKATHSGPHRAMPSEDYVQGIDTRYLNKDATFAVCYGESRNGQVWYDSGIRLTVSRVASVEYSTCAGCGPTKYMCVYVNSSDPTVRSTCDTNNDGVYEEQCKTRTPCHPEYPFNGGCGLSLGAYCKPKVDTAPRVMTSATKAFNRLPTVANVTFNVKGDLPINSLFSIIRSDLSPADAGADFDETSNQGDPVQGAHNPCVYSSIATGMPEATTPPNGGSFTQADKRAYSGVLIADGMTITIPQLSTAVHKNRLDAELGNVYALCYNPDPGGSASEWRDAYIRFKMSRVASLEVVTPSIEIGTGTNENTSEITNILTTGKLTNQATYDGQQQVTFRVMGGVTDDFTDSVPPQIALVWLRDVATDGFGTEGHFKDEASAAKYGTYHDWGMMYLDPCQEYGYDQNQISNPSGDPQTRLAPQVLSADTETGDQAYRTFGVTDLSALDSEKTYAVCYTDTNSGASTDGKYIDSGIRVTLPRITEIDYWGTWDQGQHPRLERTRTMSDWLLPTNVLPQVHNIELAYFHSTDSSNGLLSGQWVAIVDASSGIGGGSPCADYSLVESSSSSSTGAVQSSIVSCSSDSHCVGVHSTSVCASGTCTGGLFHVPQTILLNPDRLYAVCYAESSVADSSLVDYTTWSDSYVRLTITQVESISSLSITHETTGQIANHRQLPIQLKWSKPSSSPSLREVYLVHDEIDSSAGLGGTHFPCTMGTSIAANTNNPAFSTFSSTSTTIAPDYSGTIDTRNLTTYTASGGIMDDPLRCWQSLSGSNQRCIGSTNWGHRTYALCYARSDSRFFDSGIRLTVSQIATFMYESSWRQGQQDVNARYMSAAELATNTFPVDGDEDTKLYWKRDQGTDRASVNSLPLDYTLIKLMSTELDPDPCTRPGLVCTDATCITQNSGASSGISHAGRAADKVGFALFSGTDAQKLAPTAGAQTQYSFAVCYTGTGQSGGTSSDSGWRDSYVRVKISKIKSFTAESITHYTFGQLPSIKSDEYRIVKWSGTLGPNGYISLVNAGSNSNFPCASATNAAQASDSTHSGPVATDGQQAFSANGGAVCEVWGLVTAGLSAENELTNSVVRDTMVEDESDDPNLYYDQNNFYQEDKYYALCYTDSVLDTRWYDSGIRITVPKVTQVDMPSGYTGTATRVFTSHPLPTNKVPSGTGVSFTLLYSNPNAVNAADALVAGAFISLVATTGDSVNNQNNPCVDPGDAALAYNAHTPAQSSGPGPAASTFSDGMGSTENGRSFANTNFDSWSSTNTVLEYAVCYASGSGDSTDSSWRDSYIRLQITDVEWFGTKGMRHRTTGQVPYHEAGLLYEVSLQSSTIHYISMVDETMNTGKHNDQFDSKFAQPCSSGTAGTAGYGILEPSDGNIVSSSSTGVHQVDNNNVIATMATVGLNTSKTFAVCYYLGTNYATGQGSTKATAWSDSGIRITVSAMWGIQYSGFLRQEAEKRGERWRTLTSTVPELQPAGPSMTIELDSHVLPKHSSPHSVPLVYTGELVESQWVSVAQWTDPCTSSDSDLTDSSDNNGECSSFVQADSSNPCSNPATATALFAGKACESVLEPWPGHHSPTRCNFYNGALESGNKEFDFDMSHTLLSNEIYTFCYSTDGGTTWLDSYIRFAVSDVTSITASQLSPAPMFYDHGQLGNYESAVKLDLTLNHNAAKTGGWLALVDETITTSQHPCTGSAFWSGVPEAVMTVNSTDNSFVFGNVVFGQSVVTLSSNSVTLSAGETCVGQTNAGQFRVISVKSQTEIILAVRSATQHVIGNGESLLCVSGSVVVASYTDFPRADIIRASSDSVETVGAGRLNHILVLANVEGLFATSEVLTSMNSGGTHHSSTYTDPPTWFDADIKTVDYHFQNDFLRPADVGTATLVDVPGYYLLSQNQHCDSTANPGTEADITFEAGPSWQKNSVPQDINACREECEYQADCVAFGWWQFAIQCRIYVDCPRADGAESNNYLFKKNTFTEPTVNTFVGAKAVTRDSNGAMIGGTAVQLETEHLDVTKQYVACYKDNDAMTWKDTGARFTFSKLHTIRYNSAQTPENQFRLDFTTSRAKIGQPVCLSIGANPESSCGATFSEPCVLGSLCDPDLGQQLGTSALSNFDGFANHFKNRNGGCGSYDGTATGHCASGLGAVKYVCLEADGIANLCDNDGDGVFGEACNAPSETSCMTDEICHSKALGSHCGSFAAGLYGSSGGSFCMVNDEVHIAYSECKPDNAQNGGCGFSGNCSVMASTTVYNHAKKNILPQPGTSASTHLQLLNSNLPADGTNIVLLESAANSGKPCLIANANTSSSLKVDSNFWVALPTDMFMASTEYTICYNGSGVGVGSEDTHGIQWFDTSIRLRFSEISSVRHHGTEHTMQGHIPNTVAFGLTLSGKLWSRPGDSYIALSEETQNSHEPCSAYTSVMASSLTTGTVLVRTQAIFDTTGLNTRKNFAVCYGSVGPFALTDSGIRVTVATMQSLRFNFAQYSDYIPEDHYTRLMYSTNVQSAGCTAATCGFDNKPPATNRIPAPGGDRSFEFVGDKSLSYAQTMVIIDKSRNNNNPCMDTTEMEQSSSSYSSGGSASLASGASARRFNITDSIRLSESVLHYTTCYCNLYNHEEPHLGVDFTTCRDSYIHMEPTVVQTVTTYGQTHHTTGQVASRSLLAFEVDRDLDSVFPLNTNTPQGALTMVDEVSNNYHPCDDPAGFQGYANESWSGTTQEWLPLSTRNLALRTDHLIPSSVYALCYSADGQSTFRDSGIRLTVPKVTDITYSTPARTLRASTCFASSSPHGVPGAVANCYPDLTQTSKRSSQLPQSHQIYFTLNGHSSYTYGDSDYSYNGHSYSIPESYYIRLVDHELGYNDPCRTGASASGTVDMRQTTDTIATNSAQGVFVNLTEGNLMDYNKVFAVCYSDGATSDVTDAQWQDSFVRITWSHIHTLKIHESDNSDITTFGMVPAVPQLRLEWAHSTLSTPMGNYNSHYSSWLRLTSDNQNGGFPCEKNNADQPVGPYSTQKIQVLSPANEFVTMDTSMLGDAIGASWFAVCTATGDGSTTDSTWEDSGLRVRVIRWANSAKSRVVAGAPGMLFFDLSTGDFDSSNGKIALMGYDSSGQPTEGCAAAKDILQNQFPYFSSGNAVMRQLEYRCKSIGSDADSSCDAGGTFKAFDGVKTEKCILNAICTANGPNAGGCGSAGGECSAAVQLPTGKPYIGLRESHDNAGVWQDDQVVESELLAGSYSMCVCDDLNGNGGCDDANEWGLVFGSNHTVSNPLNSDTTHFGNLHVISKPRFSRDGVYGNVKHVQGRSHRYNIQASDNRTGYNVQEGDKIYFAPADVGCGQATSWSGISNSKRWRTMPTAICAALGTDPTAACDINGDGKYDEMCEQGAQCKYWINSDNGGCGTTGGACQMPRVTIDQSDQTAPILITNSVDQTGTVVTPTGTHLQQLQTMVACYATKESFYMNDPTDESQGGDYAQLDDTLEVLAAPHVGPDIGSDSAARFHVNDHTYLNLTSIRALENSSPMFKVNTMDTGDLIYFMPRTQPPADSESDCTPFVCTQIGGSLIGSTGCDADFDGSFNDGCSQWAACDPSASHNGGCGVTGVCERFIPETNHRSFTKPLEGNSFSFGTGVIQLPTDVTLDTWGAALDTSCTAGVGASTGGTYGDTPKCQPGSAKYFVTCYIPKGAIVQLSNVQRLSEDLIIFKEPTDALESTHHEGRVYSLDFTSPQQGDYNQPELREFSTGMAGDCVVLTQASDCSQAYEVSQGSYFVGAYYNPDTGQVEDQHRSMMMSLDEADVDRDLFGDVKGGIASYKALAQGMVNALPAGIYKICYATMSSECDNSEDFKMLSKEIEILPKSEIAPTLTVHADVLLGHDIVVEWNSNQGLSSQDMVGETWVGLYDKGACVNAYPQSLRHQCQPKGGRQQPIAYRTLETVKMLGGYCEQTSDCLPQVWKEKCEQHHDPTDMACISGSHHSMCHNNRCTGGIDSGTVTFSASEYKNAGDYDVRLFQGDSRNRNGIFCGGITNAPHETYIQCAYESSVNTTLKVYNDRAHLSDMHALPGLEVVFDGNLHTMTKAPKGY